MLYRLVWLSTGLLLGMLFVHSALANTTSIAIFPFEVHSNANLTYLQNGIIDMLSSRLAASGKLNLVDKGEIEALVTATPDIASPTHLKQISKQLDVDYVIFGSLSEMKDHINLDLKLFDVLDREQAHDFKLEGEKPMALIPDLNQLISKIHTQIFGRPLQMSPPPKKAPPLQFDMHTHPEKLISE